MLRFHEAPKKQRREPQRKNMSSSGKKIAQKSSGSLNTASACAGQTQLPTTTSPAKVAANRRNAQKATGPKTPAGKARSRWNSVQHGLLSKRLALIDAEGNRAFVYLLASLREDLGPQNALEEIVVEKIAIGYWRLHVAFGHESDFARSHECFLSSIDCTGRYATSIHRQLMQDISQLERLQRQRNGEFVPPPVSIELNVSGPGPDGHIDPLHDIGQAPGTIVTAVSAGLDDPNPASCPETPAAAETEEPKGLPLQGDGVWTDESGSAGATFEPDNHYRSGEEVISGGVPQELLPNEAAAGPIAGLGG
jgi:hypothetical protein